MTNDQPTNQPPFAKVWVARVHKWARTSSTHIRTTAHAYIVTRHFLVRIAGDAGEAAAVPNDQGFFKALSFTEQNAYPVSALMAEVRSNLSQYNSTKVFDGTYEAGPGYNMNGLNGGLPSHQLLAPYPSSQRLHPITSVY